MDEQRTATRSRTLRRVARAVGFASSAGLALALVDCTIERANDQPVYVYYSPCTDAGAADVISDGPVTTNGGVGTKCSQASDCTGYAKPYCQTAVEPLATLVYPDAGDAGTVFQDFTLEFPGGYCSNQIADSCTSDADCGPDGGCFLAFEGVSTQIIDALNQQGLPFDVKAFAHVGICLHPCTSNADCREAEGYVCQIPICALMNIFNQPYGKRFCVTPNTGGALVGITDPNCPARDGG